MTKQMQNYDKTRATLHKFKSGQGGEPQTVQIVRQGEATPYWFKFNPLYFVQHNRKVGLLEARNILLAADVYSEREKSDIEAMLQAMLAEVNENA